MTQLVHLRFVVCEYFSSFRVYMHNRRDLITKACRTYVQQKYWKLRDLNNIYTKNKNSFWTVIPKMFIHGLRFLNINFHPNAAPIVREVTFSSMWKLTRTYREWQQFYHNLKCGLGNWGLLSSSPLYWTLHRRISCVYYLLITISQDGCNPKGTRNILCCPLDNGAARAPI